MQLLLVVKKYARWIINPKPEELNKSEDDNDNDNEKVEVQDLAARVLRGASRFNPSSGSESIENDIIIDDEGISDILKTNGIVINPSKVRIMIP